MTAELVFQVCTFGVLPAWLLLIFAPRARITDLVVQRIWIPAVLAVFYVWSQAADPSPQPEGAGFHSLAAVTELLHSPHGMLAAWLHFLVLDLFVGAWIVRDAQRLGIRHLVAAPVLVVTLALAPVGLLVWCGLRAALRREVALR